MTPMKKLIAATISIFLIALLIPNVLAATIQVDKTAAVTSVVDGSSFTLSSGETVKLAGVDTPAQGLPGYDSSRNFLSSLVNLKTVYLTVDTVTITDQAGRLLCVAYLDYNSTFYENVNVAMVQNGYAILNSSDGTKFNLATMPWFVSKATTPSPTASLSTPVPTPTPTPYSQTTPTPSLDPNLLNPSIPEFPMFVVLIAIGVSTLALILVIKKQKKKK